jgi:hypothetical protein
MTHELQQRAIDEAVAQKLKRQARAYDRRAAPAELAGRNHLSALRARAIEKGIDFDLTQEWIAGKLMIECCEATGLPFEGLGNDPFGRTFDRIDNAKGYTKDNCWVTCWIYNRCKLNGTHADVMKMVYALVNR